MDPDQPPSLEQQLTQLQKARTLCLQDDVYWPRIFEGVVPILKSGVPELRRWGAEFFAETFSTPTIDDARKTNLALKALDTLVDLIHETEAEPLKYAVQSSASIYPLMFRYMYVICNSLKLRRDPALPESQVLNLFTDVSTLNRTKNGRKFVWLSKEYSGYGTLGLQE